MKLSLRLFVATVAIAVGGTAADAQQITDPRVADLVGAGKVRGALYLPQYSADPVTGELRGAAGGIVMIALGRALAKRLGVEIVLVGHPTPGKAVECLNQGICDLVLGMAIDPTRASEVDFSPPFMQLDFRRVWCWEAGCIGTPASPPPRFCAPRPGVGPANSKLPLRL